MFNDDLWSDLADELQQDQRSSELIHQSPPISANNFVILRSPRARLKKIVLKKVAESEATFSRFPHPFEKHAHLSSDTTATMSSNSQQATFTSHNVPASIDGSIEPNGFNSTPFIADDLWSDDFQISEIAQPLIFRDEVEGSKSLAAVSDSKLTNQPLTNKSALKSHLAESDDLWTIPDNPQILEEDLEPVGAWYGDERTLTLSREEDKQTSFEDLQLGDSKNSSMLIELENETSLQDFENALASGSLFDGLEFIDIAAELAEIERAEEELAAQMPEVEREKRIIGERGRGQAAGWGGSSSVLYIDWGDEKKAAQEALQRLGYAKIDLSETTRAFVIQSARAGSLTLQRERLLTSQLANAHFRLSRLPDQDDYEQQRNQITAEITELECILTYSMQWVAVKKAPHFLGRGIDLDDLIQYGMLGVIAGVQHFDASKGTRLLVAVNWWVFQALTRATIEHGSLIRLPVYICELLTDINRRRTELELISGYPPTHEELAVALGISTERLERLPRIATITSLNRYIQSEYSNDGFSFSSLEEDALMISEQDCIDEYLNEACMKEEIDRMMACLTPRQQQIINLRYDLDHTNGEMRTLEEIGRELCLTREQIRQIEDHAFTKIKNFCQWQANENERIGRENSASKNGRETVSDEILTNKVGKRPKADERDRRLQNKIERIRKTLN